MVNVANVITVSRVVLALFTLALLYLPATNTILWTVFGLTVVVSWEEGLDG